MDAAGRAELGELLMHRSGLAPPPDGADITSLQVNYYTTVHWRAPSYNKFFWLVKPTFETAVSRRDYGGGLRWCSEHTGPLEHDQ